MDKEGFSQPRLTALLRKLISPVAVGIYICLFFLVATNNYYEKQYNVQSSNELVRIIDDLVRLSTDYRMRFRGYREGHKNVAILAIDDESLESVGQWPWPRDLMGELFKNTIQSGAKVIAADIVWSEPAHRPELKLYEKLREENIITSAQESKTQKALLALDADKNFAQSMSTVQENFVLGNVYLNQDQFQTNDLGRGYTDICFDLAFSLTPAGNLWLEKNETRILSLDETQAQQVDFPPLLQSLYKEFINAKYVAIQEENPNLAKVDITKQFQESIFNYCQGEFLNPSQDVLWEDISTAWSMIAEESSITEKSFDEWVSNFRSSYATNQVLNVYDWIINLGILSDALPHNGYFNAILDPDSTIRRSQLVARHGNQYFPSIGLKSFLVANNYNAQINIHADETLQGTKGIQSIEILNEDGDSQFQIPVLKDGSLIINYAGPQKMFPHVRASDLLDKSKINVTVRQRQYDPITKTWTNEEELKIPKTEFLKDKILVAGVTAIGVYDIRVTPFPDETYPGVETHANIIDNILRQDFLKKDAGEAPQILALILIIGVLLAFSLSYVGAVYGLVITLLTVFALYVFDRYFLYSQGIVAATILPAIQVVSMYVALTFYKYFTEERDKRALRQTFSKYVSPQIVNEVLSDPENIELGGRKEHITVFFSDVRGFTSISEKLDPSALSDLLNSYLTPMTELVFQHKGTLDKYMGDAIMAFFGAPINHPDHAKQACACALEQLECLKELHKEYIAKQLPIIDIGIGLNTGECSVGNMGSETVRNYTVMGDAVNLGSRLEAINKQYGTRIIISEFTYDEVKEDFLCREIDRVRVKGKLQPVRIFELMAKGKGEEALAEIAQSFNHGYELYHEKRFQEALDAFSKTNNGPLDDPTAKIYLERCQQFIKSPPPVDWDGVYIMKTK